MNRDRDDKNDIVSVYYLIKLNDGTCIGNATINGRAPLLNNFLPLNATITKDGKRVKATRYINVNNINEILIENEELKKSRPSTYIGDESVRVRVSKY